jgi:hypothetical protein
MARVVIKRPRVLLILMLLVFGQGVLYLALAFQSMQGVSLINAAGLFDPEPLVTLGLLWLSWAALGAASIVMTVALQGGRPWGWTGTLVIEGAILILMLDTYFTGRATMLYYGSMALAVTITFLLNQRAIRIFFQAHRPGHLEETPAEALPDSLERG